MKFYVWSSVVIAILCHGCHYGYDIQSEVTRIQNTRFEPNRGFIEVYFGETLPEQKYEQIAFLEIVGEKYSTTDSLLTRMKEEAGKIGADAVIFIKKYHKNRERGDLIADALNIGNEKHEIEAYDAPLLMGVAVRYRRVPE